MSDHTKCDLCVLIWALTIVILLVSLTKSWGRDHAAGHDDYRFWASQKVGNCCSDQDCRGLKEDEWRETGINAEFGTGIEVKIEETWCPVEKIHFIVAGKSPDATVAHACIRPPPSVLPICERLLCFVGPSKS